MYFQLMYHTQKDLYHARLYNASDKLLMWTHSYRNKQTVIDQCWEIKNAGIGANTPVYDAISYSDEELPTRQREGSSQPAASQPHA